MIPKYRQRASLVFIFAHFPSVFSLQSALLLMFPAMTLLSALLFLVVMVMIGCDCCIAGDEFLRPERNRRRNRISKAADDVEDVLEKVATFCGDLTGCGTFCGEDKSRDAARRPSLWDDDGEWK